MLPKCSAAAKPGTLHNVCCLRREGMGAAGRAGRGGPCYPHVPRPWEGAGVPCPNPEVALGTLCSHSQQQTAPGRSESRGCTWDHGLREQGLHPLPEPRARWVATDPSPPFPQPHSLPSQDTRDSSSRDNTSLWMELCYEHFPLSLPASKAGGTGTDREMRFPSLTSQASCWSLVWIAVRTLKGQDGFQRQ